MKTKSIQWQEGIAWLYGYVEQYLICRIECKDNSNESLLFPSADIIYLDTSEFMKEITLASVKKFISTTTDDSLSDKKYINIEWFIRNNYLIGSVNGKEVACWCYPNFSIDSEYYRKFSLFISYLGGIPEHRKSGLTNIRDYYPHSLAIGTVEQLKEKAQNLLEKFIEDIYKFKCKINCRR